jgi:hypothetical protein
VLRSVSTQNNPIATIDMLCQACKNIFQGSFRDGEWQQHHKNLTDLCWATLNKCWICEKHWQELLRTYAQRYVEKDTTVSEREKAMFEDVSIFLSYSRKGDMTTSQ